MPPEAQTVLHTWCRQDRVECADYRRGARARLLTADGRSILDMSRPGRMQHLGHQHPGIVAAVRAQAARLCFVTNAWGPSRARGLPSLLWRSPVSTAGVCTSRWVARMPMSMP